ncbi:MAG: bifunctional phosphoribosyl-AMP cyclohydrolase/phosphoribosyl-ATP diphosphatase HisIE [Lachnospiraceae bacterium]|nr:bifunctional phosphoribosyl-AMP cyclohydrolase/phosphoribosyl-ATP diphosphatase HisIE [Lachnospiraceae bacterium]
MSAYKKIVPCFRPSSVPEAEIVADFCEKQENHGADEMMLVLPAVGSENPNGYFESVKAAARIVDLPLMIKAPIYRLEDVKKFLYAGAAAVVFDEENPSDMAYYVESCERFGRKKCRLWQNIPGILKETPASPGLYTVDREETALAELEKEACSGVLLMCSDTKDRWDIDGLKKACLEKEIPVNRFESAVSWKDFRLNEAGLIPAIVQDYKTAQVLMLAYMNEEAFLETCESGRMTYYSRSRKCLWKKGETSGHFQYVKSLDLDCDNDTILAKVRQVGAACHTGSYSCFFQPLARKEYSEANPLSVLEHVYGVIEDRKAHPKKGSYTNYLFEKGIDKILKKVGEEATELVIAAKNPDPEEIKYEMSDFLYHAMVLMVERGVTWTDITKELANRE